MAHFTYFVFIVVLFLTFAENSCINYAALVFQHIKIGMFSGHVITQMELLNKVSLVAQAKMNIWNTPNKTILKHLKPRGLEKFMHGNAEIEALSVI